MTSKLLVLLAILAVLGFGGYTAYNKYYQSPEKVLLRASQQFDQLKTVHADMDITNNMRLTSQQGLPVNQESKITGISDINIPDKTQKTHMNISVGGRSLEMDMILLQGGEMYIKMPLLGGEEWLSLNTKTLKEQGSLPIDPQSNDYVSQSLGFLKSLDPGSILKLEDETIDGVKTSRYRVDISTTKYLEYLRSLENGAQMTDSFQDASMKTDLWIDKKSNYIVKMESNVKNLKLIDPKSKSPLGTADMVMKINYSKHNQPVSILKPEGSIVSYEELLEKAKQRKR